MSGFYLLALLAVWLFIGHFEDYFLKKSHGPRIIKH